MSIRKGIILPSRARALALFAAALTTCAVIAFASPAFAATYDPLNIIPYDTWRASSSMSAADIQSFLDAQEGPLKTYRTGYYHDPTPLDSSEPVYHGTMKTAAQIIWDAAHAWNLNPKVILATLQKEQSLITSNYVGMKVTRTHADGTRYTYIYTRKDVDAILLKAMGCGVYGAIDPATDLTTNRSPGFGHQIWDGARVLSTYETTYHWISGMTKTVTAYKYIDATRTVDGVVERYQKRVSYYKTIVPANASTFALYTYTPYYPQKLVWDVYVRYFGDPQTPARMRPVYRFKSRTTGSLYYTMSEGTRYTMISEQSHDWSYDGTVFTVDASSTTNTAPLYRVLNTKTHAYFYTTSAAKRDSLLKIRPVTWHSSGTVGLVSKTGTVGARPVYQLENKRTHAFMLTTSWSTKTALCSGSNATNRYLGVFFSLGSSPETTPPVGP